jgi:hypothetical protein
MRSHPPAQKEDLVMTLFPGSAQHVLVSRHGHPMKGYQGIVKTVLCRQLTESGLRVVAQLSHLNPSCPYKTVVLDYDHVIEVQYVISGICYRVPPLNICYRFRCSLFDFKRPESELFIPLNRHHMGMQIHQRSSSEAKTLQHSFPSSSGNATPMPNWSPLSTPAWDPSSRTPMPTLSTPSWTPPSLLTASHDPDSRDSYSKF